MIDTTIKAALKEMDRLEMDLFSRLHHTVTNNSFAYNTVDYVEHRMQDACLMLLPHNHLLRKSIERHVYFTAAEHAVDLGYIGDWNGIPIVVNVHPTKQTRLAAVYSLNPLGHHILRAL